VDPSPHTIRGASIAAIAAALRGADAFLPSQNEIQPLLAAAAAEAIVLALHRAGFPEVLLKRGAEPLLLAGASSAATVLSVPTRPTAVVDPTGAGDAFCGAYAACRMRGFAPLEAARRAAASAALVVACSGVEAALSLTTPTL
jgi:sugar/nucleoside kinase (ribokinase family)